MSLQALVREEGLLETLVSKCHVRGEELARDLAEGHRQLDKARSYVRALARNKNGMNSAPVVSLKNYRETKEFLQRHRAAVRHYINEIGRINDLIEKNQEAIEGALKRLWVVRDERFRYRQVLTLPVAYDGRGPEADS